MFNDSSKFALKIQSKSDTTRASYTAMEAIERECAVLSSIDHPFVVDLVHHYEDEVRIVVDLDALHCSCISREFRLFRKTSIWLWD